LSFFIGQLAFVISVYVCFSAEEIEDTEDLISVDLRVLRDLRGEKGVCSGAATGWTRRI